MKKIAIVFTLIFITVFTVNAQTEDDRLKPIEGDWGLSLNISGIIDNIVIENNKDSLGQFNLFARHYLKDDLALRVGFGVAYLSQNFFREDSVTLSSGNRGLQSIDSTISRFDFKVSIGIEKHLGTTRRLDPYVGGDLMIMRIGSTKTDANLDQTDVTGTHKEQILLQQDGGAAFGLAGIAGFNYFISKNLSLGVEFGYAFTYVKAGGDFSGSNVVTPVSGSQSSTFVSGKAGASQTTIGATSTGGIMLSFFF
ncbi:MAG: outer membrane beta-barrel protein [Flavobacteriales bacterium]|nr:outer membrane beta-barrel protein [Flavobacteriales bacterium]